MLETGPCRRSEFFDGTRPADNPDGRAMRVTSVKVSEGNRQSTSERTWTVGFFAVGFGLLLVLYFQQPPPPPEPTLAHLERIQKAGVLRVVTVNSPLTYYFIQDQEQGFEFELAAGFAAHLGVRLEMFLVSQFQDLFEALESNSADLAAASITVTDERGQRVRFGPIYQRVTQQVVYRAGTQKPRALGDLVGRNISVVAGSSYAETLRDVQAQIPELRWSEQNVGDIEALFAAISQRKLEITLADSNILSVHRQFYPSLKTAFAISEPQPIAWAFPKDDDGSLIDQAVEYFEALQESGEIEDLSQRHFAHVKTYDRINTHYFLRHIRERLPALQPYFEQAAAETEVDWRLLAAMGYQESHWRPEAVSPTGVRGVMMLTLATARQMGVDDRQDPFQSIIGGARYLKRVKAKIPERIREPDRTWLALAAYNIGFGHLEDARILTQRRGGDPDKWADVEKALPLLSDSSYYSTTRHGYARGREPVTYVRNIRSYYDILIWRLESARRAPMDTAPP
jgi:membrane-bound lytic murein transglycosylase F